MKSGIYKITNPENQKFYIGSSYDIENRWRKHLEKLKKGNHPNIHFQRAWNRKTSDFLFEKIEICELEKLIEREQYYIDSLKPHYNIEKIAGSSLGVKRRDSTKQKIRLANLGKKQSIETIEKRRQKLIGKVRTDEHKRKFSEAKKGDKNPIFKTGWVKQIEAMKKANIGSKRDKSTGENISKALSKSIVQLNLDGSLKQEWESASKVEKEIGWFNSLINRVCSGKAKTAYGYLWKFKKDYYDK